MGLARSANRRFVFVAQGNNDGLPSDA